ncbi:MAG: zinc ribbon domain-containing protein [Roseovarius sp.]|nr:zinc ribbon domain-containing protein [Roseovarius sp.]
METYERVQPRRKGASLAPARKDIGEDFALRGFVCCADCGVPYRSAWAKGKRKHYAYYLCQTKACDSYGKSIPRNKLEGDFGEVVKTLQPSRSLLKLAHAMFHKTWNARLAQSKDAALSAKRQVAEVEDQIDKLLERILDATNSRVITAYEEKISQFEKSKASLQDGLIQTTPKQHSYEERLEHAMRFLASPWKIWESGDITLRRTLLRLAFTDRFEYHRIEGARTPKTALPFKVLRGLSEGKIYYGAGEGTRTPTP